MFEEDEVATALGETSRHLFLIISQSFFALQAPYWLARRWRTSTTKSSWRRSNPGAYQTYENSCMCWEREHSKPTLTEYWSTCQDIFILSLYCFWYLTVGRTLSSTGWAYSNSINLDGSTMLPACTLKFGTLFYTCLLFLWQLEHDVWN